MEKRFRNISFTTESMDEFMKKYNSQTELLPIYINKIYNRIELTEEDFEKIKCFDTNAQIRLLREFNHCNKALNER